jgi:transcriptional regulator with XRE-family HTH domain
LKKELQEIFEIDEKLKEKTRLLDNDLNEDVNIVKALKNDIYQRTCKIFIYNLKKLIQVEETQKKLAKKLGVSEDLLSKYKTGEAFPTIETLIYICKVYNLDINSFISTPLDSSALYGIENAEAFISNIFEDTYYVYFFVTNSKKEGAIHEGVVEFAFKKVSFKILSKGIVVKEFSGTYNNSNSLIYFNLSSSADGSANINMLRPNLNKSKYVGGVSLLLLASDANSKPCAQKIIFSRVRIDRERHYEKLKEILDFNIEGKNFGNIKISHAEDEIAYNFVESCML